MVVTALLDFALESVRLCSGPPVCNNSVLPGEDSRRESYSSALLSSAW